MAEYLLKEGFRSRWLGKLIPELDEKMEALVTEITRKLHSLSEVKVLEVLDFVDFLSWHQKQLSSQPIDNGFLQENEEFEEISDHLMDVMDEFQMYIGSTTPALSDYAVSRAGIYEEHP